MITDNLQLALAALRAGQLVGLPTETVYGLAADARNEAAVRSIFALKRRPIDHPLIVHLYDAEQMRAFAKDIPDLAWELAAAFWPGPLTMILPRAAGVLDVITGGQDSIGLRVPAHPIARALLDAFGDGLAAPSANRFGRISPTSAQHVLEEFGSELPIILQGGDAEVGIESTIVDVRACAQEAAGGIRILRPGHIGIDQLTNFSTVVHNSPASNSPRVSGAMDSHYAPRTPCYLKTRAEMVSNHTNDVVALLRGQAIAGLDGIVLADDPVRYAKALYASLRALDARAANAIWVETPPDPALAQGDWTAIWDRLRRAASR